MIRTDYYSAIEHYSLQWYISLLLNGKIVLFIFMTFIKFWHEVRFRTIFDCPSKRAYNLHLVWLISLLLYLRNFEWRQYNTLCRIHRWNYIVLYLNSMANYYLTKTTFLFWIYFWSFGSTKDFFAFIHIIFKSRMLKKRFLLSRLKFFGFNIFLNFWHFL